MALTPPLGHGPVVREGLLPPIDPAVGDPTAMRGAKTSAVGSWAIQQAQNALAGVRRAFSPPAKPGTALVPVTPPPTTAVTVPPGQPRSASNWTTGGRREPWFGPGRPPTPMAPWADVAGRAWDYQPGYNMGHKPRQLEGVSFEDLRALADNLDVARLCIETRKDQMTAMTWSILPFQAAGEMIRGKADQRCRDVETFMRRPDKRNTWDGWLRMLLEDQLVIDAATIYVRRARDGSLYSLEVVDGALIKPVLDVTGRTPLAPDPAYQQILKGMPAVDYTTEEMIYAPRNPRSNHAYGMSVIEQIQLTVNIAIRREVVKLKYFTENNMPEAIASTPTEWGPEQVAKFQIIWDSLQKAKSREGEPGVKFFPGTVSVQPLRSDAMLMGPFDEWIARVCCYAFSLPPTAFVQQQNRATAETAKDSALEEGMAPMMVWFKGVMDRIVQDVFGYTDLEFVWDDTKQIEVAEERNQDRADVQAGLMAIDEARAKRGLDPVGLSTPFMMGGPTGIMFADDLAAAHQQGLLKMQPPAPPPQVDELGRPIPQAPPGAGPQVAPGMPGGMPGGGLPLQPGQGAPGVATMLPVGLPQGGGAGAPAPAPQRPLPPSGPDPLAGVPAALLAAVGLGPSGAGGRTVDVTRAEEIARDPEIRHVPNKQVLATLRAAEALHRRV